MSISVELTLDLIDIAQRFVGAFVKFNGPNSKYTVCGVACHSIDQAVEVALKNCAYPKGARGPPEILEKILREELTLAIEAQEKI